MNFFDRFLYKLLFSTILLFSVVILDKFSLIDIDNFSKEINEHINVLKVLKKINGNTKIIPIEFDETLKVSGVHYKNNELRENYYLINLGDYEAVENYSLGIVVEVFTNKDKTKKVIIKGIDDITYVYDGLESISCNLYRVVESGEIIGKASFDKENFFLFTAYKNGDFYKVLE